MRRCQTRDAVVRDEVEKTPSSLDASAGRLFIAGMGYVAELQATIRRLHKCDASHSRTEFVRQSINGQVLWEGNVEVFALLGHDRALRCYAWGHLHDDGKWEVTTVLAIPPVVSAESAVLAAFAARLKEQQHDGDPGAAC